MAVKNGEAMVSTRALPGAHRGRRLALISPYFPVEGDHGLPNGARTYGKLVAEALVSRGWSVDCLRTDPGAKAQAAARGVEVIPVALPRLHWRLGHLQPIVQGLVLLWTVWRLDRRHRYDAIECIHMEGLGWALALAFGNRFFLRMHTSGRQHGSFADRPCPSERAGFWWDNFTAHHAGHLVTHSHFHAVTMAAETGVPVDRIAVLFHATPAVPYCPTTSHSDRVLFLGGLVRRKGIDTFIDANAVARSRGLPGRWTAVGADPEAWAEYARRQGSDIHFEGPVDDATLELLWQETRCLVVPSRYESFGLVVIEAMARGKPVIAARGGALPEVIGGAGMLVDVDRPDQIATAVARVFTEPKLERQLASASAERFRAEFGVARFAERLDNLFCEAIANGQHE